MHERRTSHYSEQVFQKAQQKEQNFKSNLEKDIKERQDEQNKKFLDSIQKDKQVYHLNRQARD